jgi:dihydrofolate reductase
LIISLIVAMDEKGGIGKANRLPWHLTTDLRRFKTLTMGHFIAMGRKTWETIGRQLAGRSIMIVTHNRDYKSEYGTIVDSITKAVRIAKNNHETELFIIGGGQIFQEAIRVADKIYLTSVQAEVGADVFFPAIDYARWEVERCEQLPASDKDEYATDFMILTRKQ